MIITVIGWYGTETIGDRAILAGLISLFNKSYTYFEIKKNDLVYENAKSNLKVLAGALEQVKVKKSIADHSGISSCDWKNTR